MTSTKTTKTTKSKPAEAEEAVRKYLLFLDDPAKLRDNDEIQARTQAVLAAVDPIDKVMALAALEAVANIDEAPLRDGFVKYAKDWATDVGVPVGAIREMRVSDDVLRAAGFDLPAPRRANGASRQRAKAVPVEAVTAHVLTMQGEFILVDIINSIGGSQATVRKALDEMSDAGQIEKLGPVTPWEGRGRAPNRYRVVT